MMEVFLFVLLLVVELAYFKIADRYNIIDKPNERSSHVQITLRGGGVVFYFGVFFYFIFQGFHFPWFMLGLTLISLISFADDVRPQSAKIRLLVHFLAMLCMFYEWGLFAEAWYFTFFALILCTGILNAYNFMDGINGITGGYSLVVALSLWYVNTYQIPFIENSFIVSLILALVVFNYFNFRTKAKCFAGDVGAIGVAFILLFLLGKLILASNDFSYIVFLAVYGVDSILTIIHRLILRENIFEAHRKHAYQLLANELKYPHVIVSSIYMIFQGIISWFFLTILPGENRILFLFVAVFSLALVYVVFKRKFFHLHVYKL